MIWVYLGFPIIVPVAKLMIVIALFSENPVVDTLTPSGTSFAQAIVTLWVVLGEVVPLPITIIQRGIGLSL